MPKCDFCNEECAASLATVQCADCAEDELDERVAWRERIAALEAHRDRLIAAGKAALPRIALCRAFLIVQGMGNSTVALVENDHEALRAAVENEEDKNDA